MRCLCFKTLNPVWNQSHDFEGYLADQKRKKVKVRVYDFDVITLNDPIGSCEVDISALSLPGKEHALHFDDVPLTGVAHGWGCVQVPLADVRFWWFSFSFFFSFLWLEPPVDVN